MKQKFFVIIIIIFILILVLPEESEELRIRVIANSDSNYDQAVKMQVVSVLKKEISKMDRNNLIGDINANLDELNEKIGMLIKDIKYKISIEKVQFPAKEIQGELIPGGKYKTLLVVIGEGLGKNWWSLLYPEYHNLSFEDIESGEVQIKSYFFEELKRLLSGEL